MKKAKLMLTSLAVVAIVGSALAYKAAEDKVYIDTDGDSIADFTLTGWKMTTVLGTQSFATTTIGVPVVQTILVHTGK